MSDLISWDKAIDKKVKSSDDKDLGKVQSITQDYIQTKEGTIGKKYYYIPKYYLQGYDGDHLWVSLTKDEVKSRFEGEKEPSNTTFESPEYLQRKADVAKQYPNFESNIPTYSGAGGGGTSAVGTGGTGVTTGTTSSSTAATPNIPGAVAMPWDKIIDRKVKSTDNEDIGDVERVGNEFIVVRQGVAKIHLYYIPKSYINRYDGSSLWISVPSGLISAKFERDNEPTPEEIRMLAEEDAASASRRE